MTATSGGRPAPKQGFRPSGRQILGAVVAVVPLLFIVTNTETAPVTLLLWTFEMPLWLALAIAAAMGVLIGIGLGARRTKRKYMDV